MPLVSASLVEVIRTRKALEAAYKAGDWQHALTCDAQMGQMMDLAFADEYRDNTALVSELEKVLRLYARVVAYLPESAAERWLSPHCHSDGGAQRSEITVGLMGD